MNKQKEKKEKIVILKKRGKEKLSEDAIVNILLKNRKIATKKQRSEFFNPPRPGKITLKDIKVKKSEFEKFYLRIKKAIKNKERIVVYGDYDADGVCATAIVWEFLYKLGVDTIPYMPERFSEGYGINFESVEKLLKNEKDLKLIVAVDNGIAAGEEIKKIRKVGVDVLIIDHHQKKEKYPFANAVIHSTQVCAAALCWLLIKDLLKKLKKDFDILYGLDLVGLASVADQMPVVGVNRSLIKYGIEALRNTKRAGLLALYEEAKISKENIGIYEVGYIIAPRINATGRLKKAIDSLRLVCIRGKEKAKELAKKLGDTNLQRQKIVEDVIIKARTQVSIESSSKVIILSDESYHEGVIGLAAGKLVEQFYRPAIVISKKEKISKASARSIAGFNIVEFIEKCKEYTIGGGGHPMAAGFSIETEKIEIFKEFFYKLADKYLTDDLLEKKIKVDMEIGFDEISMDLVKKLSEFEPFGIGNPQPVFLTYGSEIISAKKVGREGNHLKMLVKNKNVIIDAVGFGLGKNYNLTEKNNQVGIIFTIKEDNWDGREKIQLIIKNFIS